MTGGSSMAKYENALLIINGNAGKKDINQTIEQIMGTLLEVSKHIKIMQTEKQGDAEKYCEEFGQDCDLVIINGGDGTVHECINGLAKLERKPIVAILPGGTCNDFSRSIGMPQNIQKAADTIKNGEIEDIDIIKANDRYYSNFLGIGLIVDTSENIDSNSKGLFGKLSYYISALKTVQTKESFPFKVTFDNGEIEDEAVMILAANGKSLGANKLPISSISLKDGLLDLLIIREAGIKLLKEILSAKSTVNWEENQTDIEHIQTKSVLLSTVPSSKIDMDGEIYTKTPVIITLLSKHMRFIVGCED
jgi:diacylglycerol kinase (ATP)